jgi:hypothetical protein
MTLAQVVDALKGKLEYGTVTLSVAEGVEEIRVRYLNKDGCDQTTRRRTCSQANREFIITREVQSVR